jgi:isopentenyl diphosphate isomerase/L-lactate dehydrogenase-like FMN-dependent dehydrogenase
MYVRGDDDYVDVHAARAIAAGYDAFAITLDVQLVSRREGMITGRHQASGAASLSGGGEGLDYQASFSWKDIARFRKKWADLKLILKGIMTAADALLAIEHGCSGVWVSNHGGRQLDSTHGGFHVLPKIVKAVAGRATVIVDGGICRGTDVVKALALGADAVACGRMVAIALAAGGEDALLRALDLLLEETHISLGGTGARCWGELTAETVEDSVPVSNRLGWFSGFPYLTDMGFEKIGSYSH